jgi:hypothetical protein
MGKGVRRAASLIVAAALCGCDRDAAPSADKGKGGDQPTPVVASTPAPNDAAMHDWLVGTWSFEASCASDFLVRFGPDGALDNSGETGSWAVAGSEVTETIRERPDEGGEAPVRVDPPETRSYAVARIDQGHGTITYQGRAVPMLRC